MRECLRTRRYLRGIIDLQHYQPFNATTYTAITLLENGHDAKQFTYGVYDGPQKVRIIDELAYDDAFFDDALFLGDKNTLRQFKAMKTADVPSRVEVKNGFATLADDVFVSDEFPFDDFVIPVIKASTGKWRKGFYPYDSNGKPMLRNRIFSCAAVAEYLHSNKEALLKGRSEAKCHDWYLYGRTQALKDVWVNKYSINTVIKDVSSIKINAVPGGAGVYSGLYIVSDVPEAKLREVLECSDFIKYVSVLKKYKSGGYYTFNSRELKQYLNYKLRNEKSIKAKAVQQQFHFD
jgi:adenine-specific DNA-methyltransferase